MPVAHFLSGIVAPATQILSPALQIARMARFLWGCGASGWPGGGAGLCWGWERASGCEYSMALLLLFACPLLSSHLHVQTIATFRCSKGLALLFPRTRTCTHSGCRRQQPHLARHAITGSVLARPHAYVPHGVHWLVPPLVAIMALNLCPHGGAAGTSISCWLGMTRGRTASSSAPPVPIPIPAFLAA